MEDVSSQVSVTCGNTGGKIPNFFGQISPEWDFLLALKIPLLGEKSLFDNSVNTYSSISGHTVKNRSDQTFDLRP